MKVPKRRQEAVQRTKRSQPGMDVLGGAREHAPCMAALGRRAAGRPADHPASNRGGTTQEEGVAQRAGARSHPGSSSAAAAAESESSSRRRASESTAAWLADQRRPEKAVTYMSIRAAAPACHYLEGAAKALALEQVQCLPSKIQICTYKMVSFLLFTTLPCFALS
jgi:hypothetical protein